MEQSRNPDVGDEERPPCRLRRMRRQYQLERDVAEAAVELVLRYVRQRLERLVQRLARRSPVLRVFAPAPEPVVLLRRVGELEVKRKCP